MTAEHDIDQLYGARPEDFTALRTELVAAAKKRGDADEAKVIAAARRPTTAAWVVNALVRSDDSVRTRLADLGERLRAAHASMDGARIRELSAVQRKLIDELVRAGFGATELSDPSAALRDDVTGTLQAAIADPEVAARLGTLAKPERWSGFGEFGASTEIAAKPAADARTPKARASAKPAEAATAVESGPTAGEVRAARKRRSSGDRRGGSRRGWPMPKAAEATRRSEGRAEVSAPALRKTIGDAERGRARGGFRRRRTRRGRDGGSPGGRRPRGGEGRTRRAADAALADLE